MLDTTFPTSPLMKLSPMKSKIVNLVLAADMHGLTTDEIEKKLNKKHQTVSARVNELRDAGYLLETVRKRKTSAGKRAAVYVHFSLRYPQPRPLPRARILNKARLITRLAKMTRLERLHVLSDLAAPFPEIEVRGVVGTLEFNLPSVSKKKER